VTGQQITAGGISVELTHPGKTFFPDDGITKGDVVEHYHRAAARET
jgi:DNA primase